MQLLKLVLPGDMDTQSPEVYNESINLKAAKELVLNLIRLLESRRFSKMSALSFYSFLDYNSILEQLFCSKELRKTTTRQNVSDTADSYLKYINLVTHVKVFAHLTVLVLYETLRRTSQHPRMLWHSGQ